MSLANLLVPVAAFNLYALLLVYLRSWVYRVRVYRPMVLNIGLSVAPMVVILVVTVVVLLLAGLAETGVLPIFVPVVVLVIGLLVWLLMLPNASYLITELNLNHRRENDPVPLWYDIIAVLTLATSGVMNTVVSVFGAQSMFTAAVFLRSADAGGHLTTPATMAFVAGVVLLASFGIYVGRYIRLNSWDIANPARLARKITSHLRAPGVGRDAAGFCLTHTVFILLLYALIIWPLVRDLATGPDVIDGMGGE